ncbi:hypothetical protein WA026_014224 [Henosepilachna vigintioctopunctata]|uniref:Uncharacterized protein n=1 Tax=Henosepilachna vigintioctopunctata TaxID=420089 RepID=A0AAW1TX87_9CUCU
MTPREQRKARKIWREKAKIRRRRLALQDISNALVTPPCSDNEGPPPPQNINRRTQAAQQKSTGARKARNLKIKKQAEEIAQLKSAVQRYKKQVQRMKKPPIITPNTKVNSLLGTLDYPQTHAKFRLHVDDIYGAGDSDDEPLIQIACQKRMKKPQEIQLSVPTTSNITRLHKEDPKPSTSGEKTFYNGDFVLVKLQDRKTEYR